MTPTCHSCIQAKSSLVMIHFIFYRFAINPMPCCLNQFHFCSTYARVSYFLNMIRVVKKLGKQRKPDYLIMPFQPGTLTLLWKVLFHEVFSSASFVFGSFLSVFLECESNGKNTTQLIYDCWWRGHRSAKKSPDWAKLKDGFFVLSGAFHAYATWSKLPKADEELKEKFFNGTNWL